MIIDWEGVDETISFKEPTTIREMFELDEKHIRIGLGNLWLGSERRAELIKKIRSRRVMKELISVGLAKQMENKRTPLVIYRNGQREVVGDGILHVTEEGVVTVAKVEIRGDAVLDILQNGVHAFSFGFPPEDIEKENLRPLNRVERRNRKREKK